MQAVYFTTADVVFVQATLLERVEVCSYFIIMMLSSSYNNFLNIFQGQWFTDQLST